MLPLILLPGSGSEFYRGLGSVVVGGLTVSTAFTLILVPSVFSLVLDAKAYISQRFSNWRGGTAGVLPSK
jgi:HAE1 family hydrophobic/amphiphilic exporter-1